MKTNVHPGDYDRRIKPTVHRWHFCSYCGLPVIALDGNTAYCASHKWTAYFSMLETEAAFVIGAFRELVQVQA